MVTILHNGRFFAPRAPGGTETLDSFSESLIFDNSSGKILYVGPEDHPAVRDAKANSAPSYDMAQRIVLPGFIDSHMHLLGTAESLRKLDIGSCKNLREIRDAISSYAREQPDEPRILCRNWRQISTSGEGLASELDDLDYRPIYIHADDMHATWCNTAALQELKVDDMADPPAGKIHRDPSGRPTGLLSESAALGIAAPFISNSFTFEEKLRMVEETMDVYVASGYTGVIEMAMDELGWQLLEALRSRRDGSLPIWIAAHWLILPQSTTAGTMSQVRRAVKLASKYSRKKSPEFCITGIKVICDGVVDGCTAALQKPYSHSGENADMAWSVEDLIPVLKEANAHGMQCALHAIGDQAIKVALDALEVSGSPNQRHRIEHLELCTAEDSKRLGLLGVTASVQPVHSDPAILKAWPKLLGPSRCKHIFPFAELADYGAVVAIGTDSPTAPLNPLHNMYVATTRRSALDRDDPAQTTPQFALTLSAAVSAATAGAAHSCFAEEWTGSLRPGLAANFTVVDMQWDATKLMSAKVVQTWSWGKCVFSLE